MLDAPGRLLLAVVSLLFLCCAVYAVGYLRHRGERANRVFCACLLAFLGTMSLVTWSHHLGLMWVGDRGDHPGHRAADLLQPHAALASRRPGSTC